MPNMKKPAGPRKPAIKNPNAKPAPMPKPGKITMPVVRPRKPIGMNATRKKGM